MNDFMGLDLQTRRRRTKAEVASLRGKILEVLAANQPATCRQMFYLLVSAGAVGKTESEYKHTVVRLLTAMRLSGEIPFDWIADNTRWMRKPESYSGLEQALRRTRELYRRDLWDGQDSYVEIWCEKDAIAGVLYQETSEYDVPLMVARGYPSLSFLYSCAQDIALTDKPAFLYYFGDHDPSGQDISRNIEERLREFAPEVDITFERVAVTREQIERWGLPTRPTKRSDSRARNFQGDSVEVDAIEPGRLRSLVRDCIERHIDQQALRVTHEAEESERRVLDMIPNLLKHSRRVRKALG